jgi:amino acid adenylation domain-containing protein/natural product biosynthesis luciferase-like monooxygenase protein
MTASNGLEIAVIGMAGRFPGAEGVDAFWRLLKEGREGFTVFSDDALRQAGVPQALLNNPNYVRRNGVIERKNAFDAELFGYHASDAAVMDPQLRVFHEVVWEALEHAGYQSDKFDGLIGLYAGAGSNLRWRYRMLNTAASLADHYSMATVTDTSYLSTRVAHRLNLTGPALSANTTCSTSLVNIHLGCQALLTGECDIAVAGGVSIMSIENTGYLYEEGMILSRDGACRPFDADADGTAAGEGCGVLVLKRLDEALAANDNVLAVIKASAINNDGTRKVGFTAPSVDGQAAVLRQALAKAEVDPATVGYIEAHGTATRLGDPIEISALTQVYGAGAAPQSIAIGSVKSNIGHLGEAAGVAGAIKTILAMRHRQLPPSLHYRRANPMLELERTPFRVNDRLTDWHPAAGAPRRAGVSSFGIGGTNAHLVLEEAAPARPGGPSHGHHMVFLSAATPTALAAMEEKLRAHAVLHPHASIADLCHTLHVGRKDLPYRSAHVAADMGALATPARRHTAKADDTPVQLCLLFPGQGAQYRDMGRDLYRHIPFFRAQLDGCFAIARRHGGIDFAALLYPGDDAPGAAADAVDGAQADAPLVRTDTVQPLLFMFEYALARTLLHWGYEPRACLGHSVGEYVAACLAGVFTLEDAIAVVIGRGRLVQRLPAGAMLAVSVSEAEIVPRLGSGLSLAAVNAPRRVVVSGDVDAVGRLRAQLEMEGIASTVLRTSHAFHSHHLDPVLDEFRALLSTITLRAPALPFLSNVTGTWIRPDEATSPDYWVRHLRGTVRFGDCLAALDGARQVLIEAGPGGVLCAFAAQAGVAGRVGVALLPGEKHGAHAPADATLFDGLCQLFVHGVRPDWARFYEHQQRRRVPLPGYPFEGKAFLYGPDPLLAAAAGQPVVAVAAATEPTPAPPAAGAPDYAEAEADADAGEGTVEARLAVIWRKYLGSDAIGPHDDLFDFGVDSLLSIRVITAIRETFDTEIMLDTIFERRTIAEQAREIERKLGGADQAPMPAIVAGAHDGAAPLSSSQRRLWIISRLERDHTAYNTGTCVFVKGMKVAVLERAFRTIIARHSILRTIYAEVDGEPRQQVREHFDFSVACVDISAMAAPDRYRHATALWQAELLKPIDLAGDLMLRVSAARYDEETHFVMITLHHICSDNWTINLLMDELRRLCEAYLAGRENPLAPLPVQYIDYVLWQNAWLEQGMAARQVPYWTRKLAGIPQVHNLPLDRPRPKFQSYLGTQIYTRVDGGVLAGLNQLSQKHGATLFMTMQAAFAVLMARYSGESDIVVGFPVANRLHTEVESLIGFFVNTLVLRSDLSDNPPFADFLARTKANLLEAYAHQHLPFEMLVGELNPQRSLSYEPVAQVQLIFLDQSETSGGRFDAAGPKDADVIRYGDMPVPFSKYDLSLYFSVVDGGLSLAWEYATALFDAATITRMAANFEQLLQNIARMPERPVRELPLLSAAELDRQHANAARDGDDTPAARFAAGLRAPAAAPAGAIDFSLFYFATDAADKADNKYKLMFDGARFADEHEFHAVWTPERHFGTFGGIYPNPAITAAALAAVTSKVRIRAGSCVLPLHDPVRVAEDWSVIDNISGGRVGIGFAAGYAPNDFTLAPDKFAARRDILTADVRTVKALWRGEPISRVNGLGELTSIRIRPRPLQPALPVWVTTTGNVEAFRHAGRTGDNVLTHLMGQSLEALAAKIAAYRDEWRAAGHPGHGIVTLLAHTFIAAHEDIIFEHVKDPFKKYLVESVGTPQAPTGAARDSDVETLSERAFQRYYRSNALLGTPERCLPLVRDIAAAGVNEIACLIDFGVDPALVLENLPNLDRLRRMAQPARHEAAPAAPAPACVPALFAGWAARAPDAVALELGACTMGYGELDARSNRLANHLLACHGLRPEERVGLCMEPGFDMIVGMLAILKAGACYVPIEPSLPPARIGYMVRDAGIRVALVTAAGRHGLDGVVTLPLDDADGGGAAWRAASAAAPAVEVAPDSLAYVMYTSGSTGEPKGVMVEHAQVRQLFERLPTRLGVTADDVWALFHSFTFDVSVWEIWGALAHGGRLVLVPKAARHDLKALYRLLADSRVTILNQTPSAFYALQSMIPADHHGLALRQVHLAGEALQPKQLAQWFGPGAQRRPAFVNLYGPTETTVFATFKEIGVEDLASDRSNIGRPLPGAVACVLNEAGQPQPAGVAGELYLQGGGVARGYLNRPELTARAFVTAPFAGAPGRWYRTGDLVRWLPNGDLEYLARADKQVKVRGYRIELGEIENCLAAHPLVGEAAVLALGDGEGRYLAACVVPAGADLEPAVLVAELKQMLTDALPYYMVPQAFSLLERMPLNGNGKLDTAALSRLALARASARHVAPRTEVERALAAIWVRLLQRDDIGVTAGFFELGGQSLVAIRVINAIAQRFGIDLEARIIFEYTTIEALANFIEAGLWRNSSAAAAEAGPAADEEEFSL